MRKIALKKSIVIALAMSVSAFATALELRKTNTPPKIDGVLDDS